MLGQYFYHEILRKTVIGFGTLFNGIEIRHDADDGAHESAIGIWPNAKVSCKNRTTTNLKR